MIQKIWHARMAHKKWMLHANEKSTSCIVLDDSMFDV